ncbi:uncharacterized protein [Miscanthus floridulus]|uniref:uncharacterized protein n=1 Tax=Miscanthus floridulus TaxID=154761 RepID=UPI0034583C66
MPTGKADRHCTTAMATISPPPLRPWCDLLPELLGQVLVRLPFPADRARFRAVCRGWHTAAALHVRQLPWLVLRDGSFCTVGDGAFFHRTAMPGLPDGVTVVGSAADGWLLLDRTDCMYRRRSDGFSFVWYKGRPRRDVRHAHSYLLLNPFSGATLPLPELDAVVGTVSEVFEIYRVAMRSSTPDDLIAVVTSSGDCNVVLCRPGKGTYVMRYFRVFDVAFVGERLYGITSDEELLAFHLAEDDDGKPVVTKEKRVIKATSPSPEAHYWDWMDVDEDDDDNNDYSDDDGEDDAPNQEEGGDNSNFNADDMVLDGREESFDTQVPYRGDTTTIRMLVKSWDGELLMVRRQVFSPIRSKPYTMSVKVVKADVNMGEWISVAPDGLAKDEAIFLSRGFCKSTIVFGDIQAGFIYFDDTDDVFDTRLWTCRPFRLPWSRSLFTWLTWIFPPKLVV